MHCHHMRHRMECKPLYFEIPTQTRSRRTTSGIFRPSFSQSAGGILLSPTADGSGHGTYDGLPQQRFSALVPDTTPQPSPLEAW